MEGDEGFALRDFFVQPLPAAQVTITFVSVELVGAVGPRAAPSSALRVRLALNGRLVGTSRPLGSSPSFDLANEPMAWSREVRVFEGDTVPIEVRLVRLDLAPSLGTVATLSVGVEPPWAEGEQVFDDGLVRLTIRVSTRRVPRSGLSHVVSRSASGNPTPATLELRPGLVVELLDIVGLYEPVDDPAPGELRARRRLAYTGQDDRGRIFTNRWYDGSFERNHQAIELFVRVRAARGFLPATVTLRWLVLDPDDPSNEDAHPDAGPTLDPNDYDAALRERGTARDDNQGAIDRVPRFEAVGAYGLTVVSTTEAHTSLVEGVSRLRVHCPNVAGDNMIVRVEVLLPEGEHFAAETGVMTMWHRFDVEVVRMKKATPMPLDRAAQQLATACIQTDFAPERSIPDWSPLSPSDDAWDRASSAFRKSHRKRAKEPGWLFMAIVHRQTPGARKARWSGPGRSYVLDGTSHVEAAVFVPNATWCTVGWSANGAHASLWFRIDSVVRLRGGNSRYRLEGLNHFPFVRDGDWGSPFRPLPEVQDEGDGFVPGGYGAPPQIELTLGTGDGGPAGQSRLPGGNGKPDGSCFIFADVIDERVGENFADTTPAHEIVHCLSLPHFCGHRNAACDGFCLMHHRWFPPFRHDRTFPARPLVMDTFQSSVPEAGLCEIHVRELRRYHAEEMDSYPWVYPPPRTGDSS